MKKNIISKVLIIITFFSLFIAVIILIIFLKKNYSIRIKKLTDNIKIEKISSYDNPIVPNGFKKVETNTASWKVIDNVPSGWNEGLVIEDNTGNQFVWVPVNLENVKFNEIDLKYNYVYNKDFLDKNDRDDLQIIKYGGFYIARYEAGIPERISKNTNYFNENSNNVEGIPVSKKEQIIWNFIDWKMAKNNAIKMYQNDSVSSDLITTKQWNYLMHWLSSKGYDVINSIEWGNYSNNNFEFSGYYSIDYGKTYQYSKNKIKQTYNMLLSTGATERNKSNNIYDIAGNVSEFVDVQKWIYEDNEEKSYRNFGGYYDNISYYSASSDMSVSSANSHQGFRVVLYLK